MYMTDSAAIDGNLVVARFRTNVFVSDGETGSRETGICIQPVYW